MRRLQLPGYFTPIALFTVLMLVCAAAPMWSQTVTLGTITGSVTDATGAVVPDAAVTITDTSTKEVHTTTTNTAGRYILTNLKPGTYDIVVTKTGFSKVSIPGDMVQVGTISTNNVVMKVGAESQTVEVSASTAEIQTTGMSVGSTVSGLALDALPSIGRDSSTFLTLQAGIAPDGSVAGTVVDQSSFQLDGGSNTNDMDGSMSVYTPSYAGDPTGGIANQSSGVAAGATGVMPTPADSVEEFKVSTAGQAADFNSSSGAQVQVVTKRGTDQWHGTAYWYYLNNSWNANTWENNYTGQAIPIFHYNRYGGAIGGPLIPKKILGGKTYFFANYQGFAWNNSETIERAVPTDSMRMGLLFFNGTGYNLNPMPVTYKGVTYPTAQCPAGPCDPRGLGMNPQVAQLWNQFMPLPNDPSCTLSRCDNVNISGFKANMAIPQKDNFGVARLDHDFGPNWHFFSSYRYYNLRRATDSQYDIGGILPGNTLGVPASTSSRPQQAWYLVAGLDTNFKNNITNSFRYSYLRNWWAWQTAGGAPQLPGLGGALEPLGEGGASAGYALIPYNVNTQSARTRFWDGHDNMFRDDVTWLKGKHTIQFGGMYQHNFNYHQRTDNGGGINYYTTYQLGTSSNSGIDLTGYVPGGVNSANWGRDYAATMGIVSRSQIAYTRTGKDLALNPPLTPAFDQVTIPFWNVYGSDTWHMTSRLTLTYGLGWTLEMPPTEANGKQIVVVGPDNQPFSTTDYFKARETAALQGNVYNPILGYTLVANQAHPSKYPYNPYYGSWSPRIAAAWDVFGDGRTVIRGGYGLTYGRLNGVDLVLVPLLGTGLIQAVQCSNVLVAGCGSTGSANPNTVFRIGTDGLTAPLQQALPTLPQPLFPGVNGESAAAGEALDPNFRPNVVGSYTLTFARQLTNKVSLEIGYIGRHITHEYMGINLNAVPYMMTKGGQTFAKAYANTVIGYCGNGSVRALGGGDGSGFNCVGNAAAVPPQPFFEAALSGTGYCNGFANCTQAVIANEAGNIQAANVWSLYSDLDNGGFNFPRSMSNTPLPGPFGGSGQLTSGVGQNTSIGYGNYNALFISVKSQAWHGVSMQSNFTWSKALGTGAVVQATSENTPVDPYNLRTGYGPQAFDRRFIYNIYAVYQPSFYKSQSGFLGHVAGGWTIAPIFTTGTGVPVTFATANGGGQGFGEGDSESYFGNGFSENAVPMVRLPSPSRHNTPGSNGIGTGGLGINLYANPEAVWNTIRQPLLGYDTTNGGYGFGRGLNYWNMDLSLKKNIKITERVSTEFQVVFTNLFNHFQPGDPGLDVIDTSSPDQFGTLPGSPTSTAPRQMEFGLRVSF